MDLKKKSMRRQRYQAFADDLDFHPVKEVKGRVLNDIEIPASLNRKTDPSIPKLHYVDVKFPSADDKPLHISPAVKRSWEAPKIIESDIRDIHLDQENVYNDYHSSYIDRGKNKLKREMTSSRPKKPGELINYFISIWDFL